MCSQLKIYRPPSFELHISKKKKKNNVWTTKYAYDGIYFVNKLKKLLF